MPDQYDYATHYTYDVSGNVDRVVQEYPGLAIVGKRYFTIDYDYDLISGKVNTVTYQKNQQDQFIHRYKYDADNRITTVQTSRDGNIFYNNAGYDYYLHGPLKRVELGNGEVNENEQGTVVSWPVQGLDYAYTLQGWIKGMNSDQLDPAKDMGEDGTTTSLFPKDAFGYTVGYFDGDYTPIGGGSVDFNTPTTGMTTQPLYNGNISRVTNALMRTDVDNTLMDVQGNAYKYDQLNRLKEKQVYGYGDPDMDLDNEYFSLKGGYYERYSYDPNGNIDTLVRHAGVGAPTQMDSLIYTYQANTNKLTHVDDNVAFTSNHSGDIDDQAANNYEYDDDGNLTKDVAEDIDNIEWNMYGKIRTITRVADSPKADLEFCYGPDGNRLLKIVKPRDIVTGIKPVSDWIITYYVRDAQGNIMCTYNVNKADDDWVMKADEFVMYGSSRLGVVKGLTDALFTGGDVPVAYPSTDMDTTEFKDLVGLPGMPIDLSFALLKPYQLNYEISNFRGDVQSVVSADTKTKCIDGPDTDPELNRANA
ncbi:MAG: hypothetical protein M0D57_08615 [Sphingobacteriales bacterium JAD_PAG50586_3]|nr:MAG: hypothetical protein M0D57_08615 [Sphingobacteriales bacterium JAD_PAG50586_3]